MTDKELIDFRNMISVYNAKTKIFERTGQFATCADIAKETNLSARAVKNILAKGLDVKYVKKEFKDMLQGVITSLYERAIGGDVPAIKLFLEYIDEVEDNVVADNEIKININFVGNEKDEKTD